MADSSLLALFRTLAPTFAAKDDTSVNSMLDVMALQVSSTTFGAMTSQAVVYLTAHEFAMQAREEAAGAGAAGVGSVVSQRAGDLAVGFGAVTGRGNGDDYYLASRFGLAYLRIRDSRVEPLAILT